jgi:hypothetical protein
LRIPATADIVSSLPVASQVCFANGNDSRNLFKRGSERRKQL